MYKDIYLTKPNTSRCANSEKYIVCKYFKLNSSFSLVKKFYNILSNFHDTMYIKRFLNIDLPYIFYAELEELNAIYGQRQLETISTTLQIIKNPKLEKLQELNKKHIQKCKRWCSRHNIDMHNEFVKSI